MRLLNILLVCTLSACGVPVSQLGQSSLSLNAGAVGEGRCDVLAAIAPLDEDFTTTGIKATINGKEAWVLQGQAARDVLVPSTLEWIRRGASGVSVSTQATDAVLLSPQPEFIDLDIFDGSGAIHTRVLNPCALGALQVEDPTQTAAFGPGVRAADTLTLISDARSSWGTEPVSFELYVGNSQRTVFMTPNANRLTLVVPDFSSTKPMSALLRTSARVRPVAFEKCEGLARCDVTEVQSGSSVSWTWLPVDSTTAAVHFKACLHPDVKCFGRRVARAYGALVEPG